MALCPLRRRSQRGFFFVTVVQRILNRLVKGLISIVPAAFVQMRSSARAGAMRVTPSAETLFKMLKAKKKKKGAAETSCSRERALILGSH